VRPPGCFDAVILAGARSQRLGGVDKAMIDVGGSTLIDRVLAGLEGATQVVVVGPERTVARDVCWREEQPAGGGPVAAFSAGMAVGAADVVLLLAADLPFVSEAVPALIAGLTKGVDVAVLVDELWTAQLPRLRLETDLGRIAPHSARQSDRAVDENPLRRSQRRRGR